MSILYPIKLLHEQILVDDFFVNPIYIPYIVKTQIQPKLNWTEFEVRLHSYCEVHPPHHHHANSLLLLFTAPASQALRLYNYTVRDQLAAL